MQAAHLHLLLKRRRQRKTAHHRQAEARTGRAGFALIAILSLLLTAALSVFATAFSSLTADLPSLEQMQVLLDANNGSLLQPTRFYDRSGQELLYTLENPGITRRYLYVDPQMNDHFSPLLVQVAVAGRDPAFWQHSGISLQHLFDPQPATIPETLVDQLLLQNEETGLRRSLRMRFLAAQLVARFGLTQVLEWYLNSAWFGHLAYGAESAAQLYLGKSAADLDLAESALLISLLDSPSLNPLDAPAAAREQLQIFLGQLAETRMFAPAQLEEARQHELDFQPAGTKEASEAPAIVKLALQQLTQNLSLSTLERGGLVIYTSLDVDLQSQLECTINVQLARLQKTDELLDGCPAALLLPTLPPTQQTYSQLAASAMMVDPSSGQILAWVSTDSYDGSALQEPSPQPGSMLTPFLALAAFGRGYTPASLVWDIPSSLPESLEKYRLPETSYHGPMRLRYAIANDFLTSQSQILANIGSETTWNIVKPLGLSLETTPEQQMESVLYGGSSISLLNLTQAYTTFANLGIQRGFRQGTTGTLQPAAVLRVEDISGQIVWQESPQETLLVSPSLAYLVHHILSDDIARQTSLGHPNALEIGRPAGVKGGSADGGAQVWTVGYTPQILTTTWLADASISGAASPLESRMAAGIWHALMQYALNDEPVEIFDIPSGVSTVRVCNPSGALPTAACPLVVDEVFLTGSEPTSFDTLYQSFPINIETGKLATIFTPLELVQDETFMVVPSQAEDWAQQAGLSLPPRDYDQIEIPESLPHVSIDQPAPFSYLRGEVDLLGTAAGNGFSSFSLQAGQGLNPSAWLQIGAAHTTPVEYDVLETWQTQNVADGPYALRLQVIRQDNTLDSTAILVVVDNTPPQVTLLHPSYGDTFSLSEYTTIIFRASPSDAFGIERLEWLVDGVMVRSIAQEPYSFPWDATTGEHLLVVRAVDLAGNTTISQEIRFHVEP